MHTDTYTSRGFIFPFTGVFIGFVCRDLGLFICLVYVAGFVVSDPIRSSLG